MPGGAHFKHGVTTRAAESVYSEVTTYRLDNRRPPICKASKIGNSAIRLFAKVARTGEDARPAQLDIGDLATGDR